MHSNTDNDTEAADALARMINKENFATSLSPAIASTTHSGRFLVIKTNFCFYITFISATTLLSLAPSQDTIGEAIVSSFPMSANVPAV